MRPHPGATDAEGAARLAADTVAGMADVVEAAHAAVARPLGRSVRRRGIAGGVYRLVRWTARLAGRGLAWPLGRLPTRRGPRREALAAALNGAFGDHLAASGNALATPFQFRHGGRPLAVPGVAPVDGAVPLRLAVPDARPVVVLRVHGICMHDGQWAAPGGHDMGAALADGLGATVVDVRYNSGRAIADSGRDLAAGLEALVRAWPVPVARLVVVGHSMGGLVARSAAAAAAAEGAAWLGRRVDVVTLGSPHHGAPLERLGAHVDRLLGATRLSRPYARLGQSRSRGVTSLRYGALRDDGAAGGAVPTPPGVALYAVAATTGGGTGSLRDETVGDGLVPLASALGQHADPALALGVPPERRFVLAGRHHFDLTRRPEVTDRLLAWLAP